MLPCAYSGPFIWIDFEVTFGTNKKAVFGTTGHQTTMLTDTGPCWINVGCKVVRVPFCFLPTKIQLQVSGAETKSCGIYILLVICSPIPGEMIQFDSYFSDGLVQPPASFFVKKKRFFSRHPTSQLSQCIPSRLEAVAWAKICCLG